MGRQCKLCNSTHKLDYEKWYSDGMSNIMNLWREARIKFPDEKISYSSFSEHFKNHVRIPHYIEKEIDREKKQLYVKVLKQDLTVAEQLMKNLELCSNKIKSFSEKSDMTEHDERLLIDYLGETRMLTEEILKWKDKIEWDEPENTRELEDRVLEIFKEINLPIEYVEQFRNKLVEHESKSKPDSK